MMKIRPRRLVAALGVIVLVIGGYVGWQYYQAQQLINQYAVEAQKADEGSGNGSGAADSQTQGSEETTSGASADPTSPSGGSTSTDPSASGAQPNSSTASSDYKQSMAKSYEQTLGAMGSMKSSTLALQGHKISLSAYKASIVQAQATFSSAEAYVQANPPKDTKLKASYQEFLAGISLSKQATGVVLQGIASFSPSSFYAARDMGVKAQQQVKNGYSHL